MSFISAGNTTTTTLLINGDTTGNLVFNTGGANTTALTITNAQNTTFAGSVNAPNTFGYKNKLINGDFRVWQRGTTITPSLGSLTQYVSDRWACYQTGAALAVSQTSAAFNGLQYCAVWNGSAGNTEVSMIQYVESINAYQLYGSYATFSSWVYSSVAKTVTFTIGYANSVDNFGSITTVYSQAFSHPGTGWVQYSLTSSAPLSVSFANGIRVVITFPNCTTGTFAITGSQLEAGTQLTSFDFRSVTQELALCQRYYQAMYTRSMYNNNSYIGQIFQTYVPMRTSPTITYTDIAGNANKVTVQGTSNYAVAAGSVTGGVFANYESYILVDIIISGAPTVYSWWAINTYATAEL